MAEDDPYGDVPEHMRDWLRNMPTQRPEQYEAGVSEAWDKFEAGCCQCCGARLSDRTTIVVGPVGIMAAFCSGVCATDMANIGWLQEQHDDLVQRVKFRGGGADNGDE